MRLHKTIPINDHVGLKLEIERLSRIVDNLSTLIKRLYTQGSGIEPGLVVSEGGVKRNILLSDIAMIKSESNYSYICLSDGNRVFTSGTLKYWEQKCGSPCFCRIHRSYLINVNLVQRFEMSKGIVNLKGSHVAHSSREGYKVLSSLTKNK